MYKLLLFLKKDKKGNNYEHFKNFTIKYLSEAVGKNVKIGKVESSLLLDTKYSHFCELEVESKEVMDRLMKSKVGRLLNKDFTDFHQNVDIVFVDYS